MFVVNVIVYLCFCPCDVCQLRQFLGHIKWTRNRSGTMTFYLKWLVFVFYNKIVYEHDPGVEYLKRSLTDLFTEVLLMSLKSSKVTTALGKRIIHT